MKNTGKPANKKPSVMGTAKSAKPNVRNILIVLIIYNYNVLGTCYKRINGIKKRITK